MDQDIRDKIAAFNLHLETPIDAGIEEYLIRLRHEFQVETFESCEGGVGHAYPEPTIAFHGDEAAEGFRVLGAALQMGLPVAELRQVWRVREKRPVGPYWEIVFKRKDTTGRAHTG